MDNYLIGGMIILVVILALLIKKDTFRTGVTYVKAQDGHSYLVRKMPDQEDAANLLSRIRKKLNSLCLYLRQNKAKDPRISRLLSRFDSNKISESDPSSKYTSYSVNKGEEIVFCLRSRDSNQKLVEDNTLVFVALHELAHIMTISIGHTKEFWDNFRDLLKDAIKCGVYQYQNFRDRPVEYCGTQITDTPLHK